MKQQFEGNKLKMGLTILNMQRWSSKMIVTSVSKYYFPTCFNLCILWYETLLTSKKVRIGSSLQGMATCTKPLYRNPVWDPPKASSIGSSKRILDTIYQSDLLSDLPKVFSKFILQRDLRNGSSKESLRMDPPKRVSEWILQRNLQISDPPKWSSKGIFKRDPPKGSSKGIIQKDPPKGSSKGILQMNPPNESSTGILNRILDRILGTLVGSLIDPW